MPRASAKQRNGKKNGLPVTGHIGLPFAAVTTETGRMLVVGHIGPRELVVAVMITTAATATATWAGTCFVVNIYLARFPVHGCDTSRE